MQNSVMYCVFVRPTPRIVFDMGDVTELSNACMYLMWQS